MRHSTKFALEDDPRGPPETADNTPVPKNHKDAQNPAHPTRRFPFFPALTVQNFALLLIALVLVYITNVFGQTPVGVGSYITKESSVANSALLANIGPDGSKSSGAKVRRPCHLSSRLLTSIFIRYRPESSLPARAPSTQIISTLGLGMRPSFSNWSSEKSSAGKTSPYAERSTSFSNPKSVSSRRPTPAVPGPPMAWANQSSTLTRLPSPVLGVCSHIQPRGSQ